MSIVKMQGFPDNPYWSEWQFAFNTIIKYAPEVPMDSMIYSLADHFNPKNAKESIIDVLLDSRFRRYIDPMAVAEFALSQLVPDAPKPAIQEALREAWNPEKLRYTIDLAYTNLID